MGEREVTVITASATLAPSAGWSDAPEIVPRQFMEWTASNLLSALSPMATQFELRSHAEKRAALLFSTGAVHSSAAMRDRLREVLSRVILDGGPTPQVGATPDGSLEVEWLCAGNHASIAIEADGYISILLETDFLDAATEFEFEPDEVFAGDCVEVLTRQLVAMGKQVRRRARDWR